jgi:starvation-inducible DNA-binding protein
MLRQLLAGHEILAPAVRKLLPLASHASDHATVDALTQRLRVHETTAWTLRSTIGA